MWISSSFSPTLSLEHIWAANAIRVSHTFGSIGCCSRLRFSNWFSPMLHVYHCARLNKAAAAASVVVAAVAATTHLTQSHIPVLAVRFMQAAAAASNKKSTQSNSITLIHFLSSSHSQRAHTHTAHPSQYLAALTFCNSSFHFHLVAGCHQVR